MLLVTVPGVSSVDRGERSVTWYWSFTAASLRRLLERSFPAAKVQIEVYGNVLAAVASLHGLADHEFEPTELDAQDPHYPVIVAARAIKEARPMLRGLRRVKRFARRLLKRDRPVILCYHRVAAVAYDPWTLAVRPVRFAEQIEALVERRRVVPFSWLARELSQGRAPKRTAAVTFDDGYADVLTEGCPILERFGCPATVFLITGAIGRAEPFWWDQLAHVVFSADALPSALDIEIGGRTYSWRSMEAAAQGASNDPGAVDRQGLHLALWTLLRPLGGAERSQHLARLAEWAGTGRLSPIQSRAMDAEEVRRVGRLAFIETGAHTVTHPSMPLLDRAGQENEVEQSRRACEVLADVPIEGFAYPFGDHDDPSVATVRNAGFNFACTTEPGTVGARSDLLRLPRVTVGDWSGAELMQVLEGSRARA